MTDTHRVTVDLDDPERKREAQARVLRLLAAGDGIRQGAAVAVFHTEATQVAMETLGDLEYPDGTPDALLDELATRVAHLLYASTRVGFQALLLLDHEVEGLDYLAALQRIEGMLDAADADDEATE